MEAQRVFQAAFFAMNYVLRVVDGRQKTVDVLLEILEFDRQRAVEFLVEEKQVHEEIVAHDRLLLTDD